jgi:hypothetical protein
MDKHLNHAPAVVIMFYDLDWNDPQWAEKQTECASRVKSLKLTLDGRHTKIALVLIQQDPPIPNGEKSFCLIILNIKEPICNFSRGCITCFKASNMIHMVHLSQLKGFHLKFSSSGYKRGASGAMT